MTPPLDLDHWLDTLGPGAFDPETLKREVVVSTTTGEAHQAGADPGERAYIAALRQHAEASLYFFAKGILGLTRLADHFHRPVCDWLQTVPPYRKLYLLPRDFLKTSIARALMLHLLIQPRDQNRYFPGCWETGCGLADCADPTHRFDGANTRILYAGETAANATKQLAWARAKLDGGKLLRALWPHRVWEDSKKEAPKWSADGLQIRRTRDFPEASIEGMGVGGAVTGRHYDVLVKDDIATQEAANSRVVMETAIEWNRATRALMDDPDRSLEFMLGTHWAPGDVWQTIVRDDPTVAHVRRAILEDGVATWPELFPIPTIDRLRREEGVLFWLYRMNTTSTPEIADFDTTLLRPYAVDGADLVFDADGRDAARIARSALPTEPAPGVQVDLGMRGQRLTREVWDQLAARTDYLRMKAR